MLSTETFLAVYYLGYGFVIFLGWACLADTSDGPGGPNRRDRLHRLARSLVVVGVLHPAAALAARDIAAQLTRPEGPHDPRVSRTIRATNGGLALALAVAAVVVTSQLGPFEDAPVFRQVGAGLPFA